jgi:hypothetical protein
VNALETAVKAIKSEGPRRHADWDVALFASLAAGPALTLWKSIEASEDAEKTLGAYLRLLEEAVGKRYVRHSAPDNLIAVFWTKVIPESLSLHPNRVALLARLWNLGEGLLGQPSWVNRYVASAAAALTSLEAVEEFLVRVLEPALVPAVPATFGGPFVVSVLDTRPVDERFQPGDMHLAAPAVVCVHDRARPDTQIGLFLKKESRSAFLGSVPCLGRGPTERELPATRFSENLVHVGSHEVALPFLRRAQATLVARSGYAVASAVDSQRLWVVESP